MPKHDPFSAKGIANRQKSVGLQKLRWYCQMCQKQCRDENGFKCHTASEGHLRQMRIFAENPNNILDDFSRDFEQGYLTTLSHRHSTKRVKANMVYQEYIADKHHTHMNATIWTTLTEFVIYLGREGKCVVDETEKGWFVQYIDRDPKVLARQAQAQQWEKAELDEEDRRKRVIAAQIEAAEQQMRDRGDGGAVQDEVDNSLTRSDNSEAKIAMDLKLSGATAAGNSMKRAKQPKTNAFAAGVFGTGEDSDNDDDRNDAAPTGTLHSDSAAGTIGDKMNTKMHTAMRIAAALSSVSATTRQKDTTLPISVFTSTSAGGNISSSSTKESLPASLTSTSTAAASTSRATVTGSKRNSNIEALMREEEERKKRRTSTQTYHSQASKQRESYGKHEKEEKHVKQLQHQEQPEARKRQGRAEPQAKSVESSAMPPARQQRPRQWLRSGIVVKIVNKRLCGGELYKRKGRIVRMLDRFEAEVAIEGFKTVSVKQEDLETVIPKVGQPLIVVHGKGRGCRAELLAIHESKFNCDIRITEPGDPLNNTELCGVEYEDICKLADSSHAH